MLENSLAEKLIEQVTKYTSYNVNIMNEQGVIIASRNPERIGKFHEVAWQIVHGTTDIMVTENDNEYPGVLSGINMIIEIEGKREGVVGVTGNPDEIRPIALIIKMAIETLIKYENQKMQAFRRQTRKDRFMEMLTQKQYTKAGSRIELPGGFDPNSNSLSSAVRFRSGGFLTFNQERTGTSYAGYQFSDGRSIYFDLQNTKRGTSFFRL